MSGASPFVGDGIPSPFVPISVPGITSIPVVASSEFRRRWLQHQGLSGPSQRQGAGKYFNTIELVTIAYEVSIGNTTANDVLLNLY